ncbi:exopolysaccharide biosynthesis protein [Fluoribacter dumoffii]|uniref:Exopolysaccharide synthesis, ExoD n=1 Tax=Fluoribacter dumoffii TaxID=463 RepID=A0A377G911_9GAMM|nr:exopolysaccharide biosynthesis protein [Fluoribacter dumoffii]KTC90163.1 proton transporter [Fluoribacter dumoffii NY 23]STO21282.1 Exopolysaccharide synthesis, ExoD [Fluoribacter dumoffii]
MKISKRLKKFANKISKEITFNELLHQFHAKDNFFLIILLAVPPATPLSFIPGFSALFGACIALICIQLLMGRGKIWFPQKLKMKKIPHNINKGLLKLLPYVEYLEKYIKKRSLWVGSHFLKYVFILIILILSILLMLPVPYIDLVSSSTIMIISIGIIKKDGLLMLGALLLVLIYLILLFYILRTVFILSFSAYNFIKSLIK